MARNLMGCTTADVAVAASNGALQPGSGPWPVYTTGPYRDTSAAITDLTDMAGVAQSTVSFDSDGVLRYYSPDGDTLGCHWLDVGQGLRIAIRPVDLTGESAYDVAVGDGFDGTESEWLESLHAAEPNFTFDADDVAAGGSATATVSGTYPDLTVTLGIPTGATGAAGATVGVLTTKGDLVVRDSGAGTRLPVGTPAQVLQADPSTATGLAWGQVLPEALSPLAVEWEWPTNLARLTDKTANTNINSGTGAVGSNPYHFTTGLIPAKPSTAYTAWGIVKVAFYDATHAFLALATGTTLAVGVATTFTSHASTAFMRLQIANDAGDTGGWINEGTVLLPFEPWHIPKVTNVAIPADSVGGNELDSSAVTVRMGSNLMNLTGRALNCTLIDGTGAVNAPNAYYHVTDYLPVTAAEVYTSTAVRKIAFYNSAKVFISPILSLSDSGSRTWVTPAGAAYVRAQVPADAGDTLAWINAGYTPQPFEPYSRVVTNIANSAGTLPPALVRAQHRAGLPVLDSSLPNTYSAGTLLAARPAAPTPTAVWALWEALRTTVGTELTRTEIATDKDGNKVYRYDWAPKRPSTVSSATLAQAYPKVMITAGVHGGENAAIFNLYETMAAIFAATTGPLAVMRHNVDFTLIPLVNPSGLLAGTRKNSNGVDLARNQRPGWTGGSPGDTTYGGTAALSEPESVGVESVLNAFAATGGQVFIDHHNFSPNTTPGYGWVQTANRFTVSIAQAHAQAQTRLWKANRSGSVGSADFYINSEGISAGGSLAAAASAYGIPVACTVEMSMNIWPDTEVQSALNQTMGLESMVNFLALALSAVCVHP